MLTRSRLLATIILASTLSGTAFAATKAPTLQDQQQAACSDDVQKLCPDALPDVDKATACMKDKKSQVSAKCAAFYDKN